MDWYWTGVGISFLLWLWGSIYLIVAVNSLFEKNLHRMGQRLSWSTLTPTPMDGDDLNRSTLWAIGRYLLIVGFNFLCIFLSWINVAFAVGIVVYRRSKDAGAPQGIREFRWKMRNIEMTFDDIVKELMKASGDDVANFEQTRSAMLAELESRGIDPRRI